MDPKSSVAQLTMENARLSRENQVLRQRNSEMQSVFSKCQRRAADQQRLVRKVLSVLREVHATPRAELSANAAAEIADLRRQLDGAHASRRKSEEVVRKYEQRWAQLKASARRKQQEKEHEKEHDAKAQHPQPNRHLGPRTATKDTA